MLETAARRLLAGFGQLPVEPGSSAARIALAALARSALKRLRTAPDGSVEVRFSLLDPALPEALLDVPLLRALDGSAVSLRTLERMVDASAGVVYGTVHEVPPDLRGLDASQILDLDLHQERMLIGLLGDAAYVRVDGRDVLAEADGVRCRDFALGLRPFPDFPLLVEGVDPGTLPPPRREAVERALVGRLVAVFRGEVGADGEGRRQAARHLLWFLYRKRAHRAGGADDRGVASLPLFLDVDGAARSFQELEPALASPRGCGCTTAGRWTRRVWVPCPDATRRRNGVPARPGHEPFRPPAPSSRLGRVRPAFDFDLSDAEALADPAPPETAYAASVAIDDELAVGTLGVPMLETPEPAVSVLDPHERRMAAVRGPAGDAAVVGRIVLRVPSLPPEVTAMLIERATASLLDELARRIPVLAPRSPEHERCTRAALGLAARRFVLTAQPDGTVALDVLDAPARRVLDLPLFPAADGIAVSGWCLLREFAASRSGAAGSASRTQLAADAPGFLREWLARQCCDERIVRPANHAAGAERPAPPPPGLQAADADLDPDGGRIGRWLTSVMRRLHQETAAPGAPIEAAVWDTAAVPQQADIAQGRSIFLHQTSQGPRLIFDTRHWLLARMRAHGARDPEAAAWLLLAAAAHLNVALESITSRTEMHFQARVLELLQRGELVRVPTSPADIPASP